MLFEYISSLTNGNIVHLFLSSSSMVDILPSYL